MALTYLVVKSENCPAGAASLTSLIDRLGLTRLAGEAWNKRTTPLMPPQVIDNSATGQLQRQARDLGANEVEVWDPFMYVIGNLVMCAHCGKQMSGLHTMSGKHQWALTNTAYYLNQIQTQGKTCLGLLMARQCPQTRSVTPPRPREQPAGLPLTSPPNRWSVTPKEAGWVWPPPRPAAQPPAHQQTAPAPLLTPWPMPTPSAPPQEPSSSTPFPHVIAYLTNPNYPSSAPKPDQLASRPGDDNSCVWIDFEGSRAQRAADSQAAMSVTSQPAPQSQTQAQQTPPPAAQPASLPEAPAAHPPQHDLDPWDDVPAESVTSWPEAKPTAPAAHPPQQDLDVPAESLTSLPEEAQPTAPAAHPPQQDLDVPAESVTSLPEEAQPSAPAANPPQPDLNPLAESVPTAPAAHPPQPDLGPGVPATLTVTTAAQTEQSVTVTGWSSDAWQHWKPPVRQSPAQPQQSATPPWARSGKNQAQSRTQTQTQSWSNSGQWRSKSGQNRSSNSGHNDNWGSNSGWADHSAAAAWARWNKAPSGPKDDDWHFNSEDEEEEWSNDWAHYGEQEEEEWSNDWAHYGEQKTQKDWRQSQASWHTWHGKDWHGKNEGQGNTDVKDVIDAGIGKDDEGQADDAERQAGQGNDITTGEEDEKQAGDSVISKIDDKGHQEDEKQTGDADIDKDDDQGRANDVEPKTEQGNPDEEDEKQTEDALEDEFVTVDCEPPDQPEPLTLHLSAGHSVAGPPGLGCTSTAQVTSEEMLAYHAQLIQETGGFQ